jgi:hypothetical protein
MAKKLTYYEQCRLEIQWSYPDDPHLDCSFESDPQTVFNMWNMIKEFNPPPILTVTGFDGGLGLPNKSDRVNWHQARSLAKQQREHWNKDKK